MPSQARDPRAEASARVGDAVEVRVLEPSPPAVGDGPWFADDPVAEQPRLHPERPLLSPVPNSGRTWDELARTEVDLSVWCADRWLGAWRRLPPLPPQAAYTRARAELHELAATVVSPAREAVNGKIGLRYTYLGFGTPFFGDGEQLRVHAASQRVLHAHEHTPPRDPAPPGAFLGEWYGFACSVLEDLRARGGADADPSRVQLWPEHFDMSVDLGVEAESTRGTFGASPGDDEHPEPYLYVTHWAEVPDDPYWNDSAFPGASLPLTTLVAADDQRETALEFFRRGRDHLRGRLAR
jgi:hypothetical protein